ncbi:ABC transporter permease [Caldiplasma sukawensis]
MFRFFNSVLFYIKNTFRSKAFFFIASINCIISVLMVFLIGSSNLLLKDFVPGNLTFNNIPSDLKENLFNFQWANILIYIPVLTSAFFGSTALPYEYERSTINLIFSLPVEKFNVIFSRIMGATIVSFLTSMIIVFFQFIAYAFEFKDLPNISFIEYILLLFLVTLSDVAFAVAVSTFFRNSGHSAISFLILYLVILNIFSLIASGSGIINPVFIKTNADRILYRIFLNSDQYFLNYSFSLSSINFSNTLFICEIIICYTLVCVLIAYISFILRGSKT